MIFGHQIQQKKLQNDITQNNISHAYLFTGLGGIGKFTVAKNFARQINGIDGQANLTIYSDIVICDDLGESLKIEMIRNLCVSTNLSKDLKYKIVLIKNIERMTLEAANAFLKTLEEPNSQVVFLLTTSNSSKILETIISRVRVLQFQPLNQSELCNFADSVTTVGDKNKLDQYIFWSAGRPAKLYKLIFDSEYSDFYEEMVKVLEQFFKNLEFNKLWPYFEQLAENKQNVMDFLEL